MGPTRKRDTLAWGPGSGNDLYAAKRKASPGLIDKKNPNWIWLTVTATCTRTSRVRLSHRILCGCHRALCGHRILSMRTPLTVLTTRYVTTKRCYLRWTVILSWDRLFFPNEIPYRLEYEYLTTIISIPASFFPPRTASSKLDKSRGAHTLILHYGTAVPQLHSPYHLPKLFDHNWVEQNAKQKKYIYSGNNLDGCAMCIDPDYRATSTAACFVLHILKWKQRIIYHFLLFSTTGVKKVRTWTSTSPNYLRVTKSNKYKKHYAYSNCYS